jgi:hypothetical protein
MRKDLEKVRLILDIVRKRERLKLRIYKAQRDIFEGCLDPLSIILKAVLEQCKK